ncbi:hypothetical protein Rhopal_004473-T1 [Rhodotorula paludigena]|uniref:CAP-Gly domain-containing protein n=1 Tax=Rhodotorula paludigena TaxID=86838 RepID=A0AAV5GNI7_9BASI|nr:hypothetical protein Rhopal_004473-T1 [Rhodotorula paludigena]
MLRPPSTPRASLGGSALPTPSSRRKSGVPRPPSAQAHVHELSSLRQAISAHDPASYDSPDVGVALGEGTSSSGRQPIVSRAPPRPTTPSTPSYSRARTPTGFGSSTSRFPKAGALEVGAAVSFEVAGELMEGTLRFVGEVEGKAGTWAGVELDEVYAGRGKNDGSVAGQQYFACPPQCGLFLPIAKVTVKPRPSSAASMPPPPLTAGSRASKYAGMSAKDLASRRASAIGTPSKSTPTAATPAKPRTSMSPTKRLSQSTSTLTTPKPTRLSRPSIGGASTPTVARTPSTVRKTPRPSLGASVKRPPSSLRHTAPEVPPIPSAYGLSRSVTPSSQSGRATPSTPGAMMRRRTSLAQSETSSARPTTPSFRSHSRQSLASSVSRQSHRSNLLDDESDEMRRELVDARAREGEIRQLLEGSEKLGREMEDRLLEKSERIKALEEQLALAEAERQRAKAAEDERLAGVQGEEGDRERDKARLRELEAALEAQKAALDKVKLEDKHKSAAKEAEVESLRERLEQAAKAHDDERADLTAQVDKLRTAGQALCETYEERIAEIELARLEEAERAEALQARLDTAGSSAPPVDLSASVSAAQAIDAESARADIAHLRGKVSTLEEQLEDARMQLEQEVTDARERRTKTGEVEQLLKGEIKQLKQAVDRAAQAEQRAQARIQELQAALHESQATLEAERSELEGLRHDASGDATAALADDLKRVHKELSVVKVELEKSQREAALVSELREDLRNAEKEIERLQKLSPPPDLGARRSSAASSIGAKDEATATRDQIVGLKTIIETLTEENRVLGEKSKAAGDEVDSLKDAQRALEATVQNLMQQLDDPSGALPPATVTSDPTLKRELEDLRKQLAEVERKSELEIKALNQEVTELESLVESKIYREDELETELEKYKALAAKTPGPSAAARPNGSVKKTDSLVGKGNVECEMCGEKGHDLDSEKRSSVASTSSAAAGNGVGGAADYCDDCEEYGHSLEDCPLASEIF